MYMRYLFLIFLFIGQSVLGQVTLDYDPNQIWVTDPLNYLTPSQQKDLNTKLSLYEKKTGNEVAVVFQDNWDGMATIEDYSNALFRKWGIGKKGANNGLLVVVSPGHRKWRIEIGYGLEGYLTDIESKEIGEEFFKPYFKNGKWYDGVNAGIDQIIAKLGTLTLEQKADQKRALLEIQKKKDAESAEFWNMVMFFLFGGIFITGIGYVIWYFIDKRRRKKMAEEEEKIRQLEVIRRQKEYEKNISNEYLGYIQKYEDLNKRVSSLKEEWMDCINFNYIYSQLKVWNSPNRDLSILEKESESRLLRSIIRENEYFIQSMERIKGDIENIKNSDKKIRHSLSLLKIRNNVFQEELIKFNQLYPGYFTISKDPQTLFDEYESQLKSIEPIYSKLPKISSGEYSEITGILNDLEVDLMQLSKYFESLNSLKRDLESAEKILSQIDLKSINEASLAADISSKRTHVTSKTRQEFLNLSQRLKSENFEIDNKIKKASLLHYFYQTFLSIDKMSEQDIQNHFENEERKRKELIAKIEREKREKEEAERRQRDAERRRREEEEEERRRNSYSSYSSYSSSNDSSSSYDSGSSFGGGDSGGGGSSGDF